MLCVEAYIVTCYVGSSYNSNACKMFFVYVCVVCVCVCLCVYVSMSEGEWVSVLCVPMCTLWSEKK